MNFLTELQRERQGADLISLTALTGSNLQKPNTMDSSQKSITERFKPLLKSAGSGSNVGVLQRQNAPVGELQSFNGTPPSFKPLPIQGNQPVAETARCHEELIPSVTLIRDKGVVTGVKVECACGRIVELACVYD